MNQLQNLISKKNNNNIIMFKLGKIVDNNFNNSINDKLFNKLLNEIKIKNNHKIDHKYYNLYHDKNNVYTIYDNGYEKHFTYLSSSKNNITINDTYDLEGIEIKCIKLPRDAFQIKDNYDRIIFVNSTVIHYAHYIIEFNKINENNRFYNEINIIINNSRANVLLL